MSTNDDSTTACPACGTRNRVPAAASGLPACASCRAPLPWSVDAEDVSFRAALDSALPVLVDVESVGSSPGAAVTERQGRWWIFGSFLLCPCHLPLTLGILLSVLGGTAIGGLLRDHALTASLIITLGWVVGTANGFRLVRHAQRGTCPVPRWSRWPRRALGEAR